LRLDTEQQYENDRQHHRDGADHRDGLDRWRRESEHHERDDRDAARLAGIRTNLVLFSVYAVAGLIVAVAAAICLPLA